MLAQRLRRWPNIKTTLFQRVAFAGQLFICAAVLTAMYLDVICLACLPRSTIYQKARPGDWLCTA